MPSPVLKELLESEVLTEATKASITAAFQTVIQEAEAATRARVEEELTTQFAQSFAADRDALIESVDKMVANTLREHLEAKRADLESFRDLEAEAANLVVEAKAELVAASKTSLKTLVEQLDKFLDVTVAAEFAEIREDLLESQRRSLGLQLFEGFRKEFQQVYAADSGVEAQLAKIQSQLASVTAQNRQLKESLQVATRDRQLATTLAPLEGKARQVMETILATVATDKLQETYERFVDRVLTENAVDSASAKGTSSEKENQVLAEGKVDPVNVSLRTGDEPNTKRAVVTEGAGLSEADKRRLLLSAGLA